MDKCDHRNIILSVINKEYKDILKEIMINMRADFNKLGTHVNIKFEYNEKEFTVNNFFRGRIKLEEVIKKIFKDIDKIIDENKIKENFIKFCANTDLPKMNKNHINQSTYVMEECAELIQALNKDIRGYDNAEHILEEIGDVICTIGVYCTLKNITYEEVMEIVNYKIKRALSQNKK